MRCDRCAGLVVGEHAAADATSIGCWIYAEWRCVNCGAAGVSVPTNGHSVSRGIAGSEKVGRPRRALNTEPRRS